MGKTRKELKDDLYFQFFKEGFNYGKKEEQEKKTVHVLKAFEQTLLKIFAWRKPNG